MRTLAQRFAIALGVCIVVGLLLLGLRQLASGLAGSQLWHESEQMLVTVQGGQPLWQWRLRKPDDLIAGRAFGAADVYSDKRGLRITSRDGMPFELGMPLAHAVDLRHWSLLRIQGGSSAAGTLSLVWQEAGADACRSDRINLPAGNLDLSIDLRALSSRQPCAALSTASMLRLRPQIPAGTSLLLTQVALLAADPPSIPTRPGLVLSTETVTASRQLRTYQSPSAMPLVKLHADAPAETLLQLRDQIRARWPAALLQVGERPLSGTPHLYLPTWTQILACGLYLLGLLWLWRKPLLSRHGNLLELIAILAGPLWLIAGLQWGTGHAGPAVAAFAGALLFAAIRRDAIRSWQWFGHWQDAAWAAVPVLAALTLVLSCGHLLQPPGWRGAMVYLMWATLQQWLMLGAVLPRLEKLTAQPWLAVVAVATLFALLHTPNGVLMQLCLLAECWWAWCFLRRRSLLPIATAHAACALLVQAGLSGGLLRSLEVSARFFH